MVGEVKNPCEECIIKMICKSFYDCIRWKNYFNYVSQKEKDKVNLAMMKNQATVDRYFKRFRRSR